MSGRRREHISRSVVIDTVVFNFVDIPHTVSFLYYFWFYICPRETFSGFVLLFLKIKFCAFILKYPSGIEVSHTFVAA
jgi:hypothetical protein